MKASDYRRIAREKLAGNWAVSIATALVAALLGGVMAGSNVSLHFNDKVSQYMTPDVMLFLARLALLGGVLTLVQFILGGPVRQGYCSFLLKQHDGKKAEVKDLFSRFDRFGDGFVLFFLEGLYIFLWGLLFIIPGFIAAFRYAMAPYIMLEHPDMKPSDALKASSELMDGHKWELFCLHLSFIGWSLLSLLTLNIGDLWLNPYINAAHAAFYREISRM